RTAIESRVVIGDPHNDTVTMGPLVSTEQRDDVLKQVAALKSAGGRVLVGSTDAPPVVHADGTVAPAPEGAFVAPILVGFGHDARDAVHEVEAFGPVASLLPYSTLDEAARLVDRGGGSLVTSVATNDPSV